MPLWLLALIVAAGLAIVIATVHLSGGRRAGSLNAAKARKVWQDHRHEEFDGQVLVSDDCNVALFVEGQTELAGLVVQMGAHEMFREVRNDKVRSINEGDNRLIIRLAETTLPVLTFMCSDETTRRSARAALTRQETCNA